MLWTHNKRIFPLEKNWVLVFEEKAFYDILPNHYVLNYDFTYPEEKMIELAKGVKELV
jgi:type I restriction enzyme R subunit